MGAITTIFFDIGGVCLSNGWDHEQRQMVAQTLGFDYEAFDSRHRQVVDSMERGQLTLEEYLNWTLFYEPRPFTTVFPSKTGSPPSCWMRAAIGWRCGATSWSKTGRNARFASSRWITCASRSSIWRCRVRRWSGSFGLPMRRNTSKPS
jgi:hypothetical protein